MTEKNGITNGSPSDEDIICWACHTHCMIIITHESKEYYICTWCNPNQLFEECIDGCLYVCHKCRKPVPIGIDKDYDCSWCEEIVCLECVVWKDENDDFDLEDVSFCSKECLNEFREDWIEEHPKKV